MNPDLTLALEFLEGNCRPVALTASPLQRALRGEIVGIDAALGASHCWRAYHWCNTVLCVGQQALCLWRLACTRNGGSRPCVLWRRQSKRAETWVGYVCLTTRSSGR